MATVYADSSDGYVTKSSTSNWASARDASSGTALSTGTNSMLAIRSGHFAGRGGTTWIVTRVFMYFDTSGITSTLASATLKIRGRINNSADFYVVKSTHGTSLANGDFDAITGWSSGADNRGNVTAYSGNITTWNNSAYNDITLNATALSDMVSLNDFTICLIESSYDLPNSEPPLNTDVYSGMYFQNQSGTSYDPYIDYTVATTTVTENATFFGTNF